MNRVEISGRLTRDPEIKFVGDSRFPITSMNVAVDDGFGRFDRELKKSVYDSGFYQVEVVGDYARYIASIVHKGDEVYVVGSLSQFRSQPKDGGEGKTTTRIKATMVNVLTGVRNENPLAIPPPADPPIEDDPWMATGWSGSNA